MPGKPPGKIVLAVLDALEREGPMTRAAICRAIGVDRLKAASVVSRLNHELPTRPKRIYITHYVYDEEFGRDNYPRAVYALGDLPDADKPRRQSRKETARRYRARRKLKVASVWEWAMPRRAREQMRKELREQ